MVALTIVIDFSVWQYVSVVAGYVVPISDDVKGENSPNYSEGEIISRCKLASLHRVMNAYGWTDGIWNHITVTNYNLRVVDFGCTSPLEKIPKQVRERESTSNELTHDNL